MQQYLSELRALHHSLPAIYSEKNLEELNKTVGAYNQILTAIAAAEEENNTQFYREQMTDLESHLQDARYGHSEKQRAASFAVALAEVKAGISALINNITEF